MRPRFNNGRDIPNFNVIGITDSSANVIERYSYTPYGEATVLDADYSADADGLSDIGNELLYTGRRLDPETGLQLNRNRFYASHLGRWVNRDPIGYFGGTNNLYEYVNGKPTIGLDSEGTDCPGCDLPAWLGADGSICVTNCCFVHDVCFKQFDCTAWSWAWNIGATAAGGCVDGPQGAQFGWWLAGVLSDCARCNKDVVECITKCALGNHMGPASRYFCAKLGREVKIPSKKFPNLDVAKAACCSN